VVGVQRPLVSYRTEQVTYRLKELDIIEQIQFETIDLRDKSYVDKLIKKYQPTYIAHLGSQSDVKKSFENENLTNESNSLISKNIVDSIHNYSKESILFFPSSAAIYEGYKNMVVTEKTTPAPQSAYSISKYETQNYIQNKLKESNLQLNVGIMFSHESEFRRSNFFSKKIVQFLADYKNNNTLQLDVGDIFIERDIGYAQEYVDAIFKIMILNDKTEFIVSSNRLYKLSNFIENCLNILEINFELDTYENIVSYKDSKTGLNFISSNITKFRKYDLRGIQGDNSKIKARIGWNPTIELEEICERMVSYEMKKKSK
jgi:GDPmannose 4,6-dehydratase